MRKLIVSLLALCGGVYVTSAAVTVQGWWRFGELTSGNVLGDYAADSSGNVRRFRHAFSSTAGSGNAGGIISPFGAGGPLGTTGAISTNCCYWLFHESGAGGMWNPGNSAIDPQYGTGEGIYNPPPTNYVIECWILPNPDVGGSGKFFMSGSTDFTQPNRSGSGGGVYFQRTNDGAGGFFIAAFVLGNASQGVPADAQIGTYVAADPNHWMHVAVVNNAGTNTFYVNGVQHGPSQPLNTIPNGNIFAGCSEGTERAFHGYLDEFRFSTFAPGAFSTNDLLLRPAGPNILIPPAAETVWDGGAAPFTILAAFDTVSSYQWQRNGTNIPGAITSSLTLPQVFVAPDSGAPVDCVLIGGSITTTSSPPATLTVIAANAANVAAYRNLIVTNTSLLGYFPVDNCTGSTITNIADPTRNHDGTLELNGNYDGITNHSFGQRALAFNTNGDVTIPNNPAFEFAGGNGTIEALVYLSPFAPTAGTIFSEAYDFGGAVCFSFGVSSDGGSLVYTNDNNGLTWQAPGSLVGNFTHVALVFDHGTNVTAYANGQSLGTKIQSGFGAPGASAWIGSQGLNNPFGLLWKGTIDELAVYGSALSANTIAIHNATFLFGTNTSAPVITSLPATGSRSLLAGGVPAFTVGVSGTPPLSYQWTTNSIPIAGATTATLTLSNATVGMSSPTYGVTVHNNYGTTNSPTFGLTFVAPSDSYALKVMNDHPSAYWRLDEPTGSTTALDQAGAHDGTFIFGTAPGWFSTNGLLPSYGPNADSDAAAWLINPGANLNCRVEVPYSPVLNPSGPYTIECFCNPNYDGNDSGGYLVSSQYRVGTARSGYMLGASANSVQFDYFLPVNSSSVPQISGGPHCLLGVTVHVVGVYDGTNGYLYCNGALAGTLNNPAVTVNPSAPLELGVRNGGAVAYDGILDEVAFYGYALSANQISNHWASLFAPALITTAPVGVTNIEGSTISLTAVVAGYGNTYQWFKDNAMLADAINPDGTQHYPQGVINPTLVITQTRPSSPSDSGSYKLVVSNPVGGITTVPVNVLITNDVSGAKVTYVAALGTPNAPPNASGPSPYLVKVLFNKRIVAGTGTYLIAGTTVNSAAVLQDANAVALGADWREVILTTTGLTPGQSYTLNVSGVQDQTVSGITMAATNISFRAPLLSKGLVQWDYYYLDASSSGAPVSDLTVNQNYPNAPMTNGSSSTFDTTPITGGALENKGFGALGNNYGDSLSGWITPTVAGNYTFFISSDDTSQLWLSTDSNPANAAKVAEEISCCQAFLEPNPSQGPAWHDNGSGMGQTTLTPITLQANTPYFIRALHAEGGGGDYVKVAWRIAGDSTPAATLQPIPGAYLSSYASGPINFNPLTYSGGTLTLSWTGTATLMESTNIALPFNQWTPVPGNPASPFQVTPVAGAPHMFYRLKQ